MEKKTGAKKKDCHHSYGGAFGAVCSACRAVP